MDVFDLYAKITLDTTQYENGLKQASSESKGFGSKLASGFGAAAKLAGAAISAASTAVVAFGGASIKAGADFDSSMAQVAATMGKTVDEIGDLRDFAQEMGSTTVFSATQAADALNYMALAGYDAEKSMGMLPNVLNLAAAGGIDLAYASDMVTDAASALGLNTEQTTVMIDQFAAAASKSNTSVSQLGEAILTIGATAKNVKGGTKELSTVLGALADNGIKGSEGGTHLRNMLLSLQNACEDGKVAFGDFTVSVYDADGNMRSMIDIIDDMRSGMDGMTQEAKDALISGVFNKTDLSSINALLNTTSERFEELGASIEDSAGAAEKMAAVQLDNLTGDITLFKSALEGLQIAVSDELTPSFREFVQFGSEGLSSLTNAFKEGGLSGAMEEFGTILSNGLSMIVEGLPGAVDAGIKLLEAIGQGIMDNIDVIVFAGWDIVETLMDSMVEATNDMDSKILEIIDWIVGAFVENSMGIIDSGYQIISNVADGMAKALPEFIPTIIDRVIDIFRRLISPSNIKKVINSGLNLMKSLVKGVIEGAKLLIAYLPDIVRDITDGLRENFPTVIQTIVDLVLMIVEELPGMITSLLDALPDILIMIVNTIVDMLPVLIDGIIKLVVGIAENLPKIIQAIIDALPKVIQAIIGALNTLIPAIVQGLVTLVVALVPYIPQIIKSLIEAIPQVIAALLKGFLPFGDELVEFFTDVFDNVSETVGGIVDAIKGFFEPLLNWFDETLTPIWDLFKAVWEGIKTDVSEHISELRKSIVDKFTAIKLFLEPIMTYIKNLIVNAWKWAKEHIIDPLEEFGAVIWEKFEEIRGWAEDLIADALEWGKGIAQNLTKGLLSVGGSLFPDTLGTGFEIGNKIVEYAQDAGIQGNGTLYQEYTSQSTQALNQMVGILQEIKDGGMNVALEGDAADIFNVVNKQNRVRTKATGYNSLAMAGG